jgi:hypothetical protein
MISPAIGLSLLVHIGQPPPGYIPHDAPMPPPVSTVPQIGVRLFRETCWDHLRDPVRLRTEAERLGFNYFWVGSHQVRVVGTGTGTLNYFDAGQLNPRGSDRQCDIYMRIDPLDHQALASALAAATGLATGTPFSLPRYSERQPQTLETRWTVQNSDGTTSQMRLVSYGGGMSGNVHFFLILYPRSPASARPAQ